MTQAQMVDKVIAVLREFGVRKDILPDSKLTVDLGLDSMDLVELNIMLDTEFNAKLDDMDINPFMTVKQVADLILTRCK